MAVPGSLARVSVRQLALFVLAMVVPAVVLVGLGVRIIVQQEELTDKHLADQHRLRVNEFERTLVARLDRIRRDPRDPAVALTAAIVNGRLVLPWDARSRSDPAADAAFGAAIAAAEREEFGTGRLDAASAHVDRALTLATSGQQKAYARLLRARILVKAHRLADADGEYRALLRVPLSTVDQDGMPYALYAADRLVAAAAVTAADLAAVDLVVDDAAAAAAPLPPAGWYLLRTVDARIHTRPDKAAASSMHRERIDRAIAEVEHALDLQRSIQAMVTQWRMSDGAWLPHGGPLWLVGTSSPPSATEHTVIAVRADLLTREEPGRAPLSGARLVPGTDEGEWLGGRFPGLKVSLPPIESNASERNLQRAFYAAALTIVLSVTLFGGYLLWRDVNREMRVATLRSQFVSSVSHELKTPLTAIRMFAETLQLDRVGAATRGEYLDTIVNETERLTRLLNNVLDFSKIEEGRKAYRREAASLADVVRAAARAMAYQFEQHGFVLRVSIDESLPAVDIDADALEQAVLNLLTNAMKYSGSGRTIDLCLSRSGGEAIISVRDEGIGIAPADQARIFEKFYRISTPENQRIPGTGLGLTLVDHIVKGHDGSVRVESAPGRGSVFAIHLPLGVDEESPLVVEATS
jgi:signal transduction histidine kinase